MKNIQQQKLFETLKEEYGDLIDEMNYKFQNKFDSLHILPNKDYIPFVTYDSLDECMFLDIIGFLPESELIMLKDDDDLVEQITNEKAYTANFTFQQNFNNIMVDKYYMLEVLKDDEITERYKSIKNDLLDIIYDFGEFNIKPDYNSEDWYPIGLIENKLERPFEIKRLIGKSNINSLKSSIKLEDLTVQSLINVIDFL